MGSTRTATVILALATLAAGSAWAADRDVALAILDQAIKAHGGTDALNRVQTGVRTSSGTIALYGKDLPFADEMIWQLPHRFRLNLEVGTGQDKSRIVLVATPDKGWQNAGGMAMELGRERLTELQDDAYVLWLATLTPLRQAGFDLTPLPEIRIEGRTATGVLVGNKGHAETKVYFDKETGLLVKMERRAREAGVALDKEYLYSSYKDFDGVKLATKLREMHNGSRFADLTNISYRFLRAVNDATFARP
jgi:hypothetical protein